MATGLDKTFRHLAKSKNDASIGVLLTSLDSPHAEICEGALCALLDRRGNAGGKEILDRLPTMTDRWKEIVRGRPGRLTGTLRDAVVGSDTDLCEIACQAILDFCDFDLMPTLINAAEDQSNPQAKRMAETVLGLAELLYDELAKPRDYKQSRDPNRVRQNLVATLENSVRRYAKHQRTEILEAFAILANRDNVVLKKILDDPFHKTYLPLIDVLTHSASRGVMRLVLSFLDDPRILGSMLTVISHRDDETFLGHLLRKIGSEPTTVAKSNLRRIESVPWIAESKEVLAKFGDAEQHAVVQLAIHCQLPQEDCLALMEYLLVHGTLGGRCAAASALANYSGAEANQLALAALDDAEPRVQVAIIPHLRQRGIPGAMNRLLEMVDHPVELVCSTAREQLVEFHFDRFLDAYDGLDEEVRQTTGRLVCKVDPQSAALLARELIARLRTHRLRAIDMTVSMDMVARMETHLLGLLEDEEHMVRLEAARALAACSSDAVREALQSCLADRSVGVQEAAEASLQGINRRQAEAEAKQQETTKHEEPTA